MIFHLVETLAASPFFLFLCGCGVCVVHPSMMTQDQQPEKPLFSRFHMEHVARIQQEITRNVRPLKNTC